MGRINDVLQAIGQQVTNAINGAQVVGATVLNTVKNVEFQVQPGNVFEGWPLMTELVNITAAGDGNWQISLFPLPAKALVRFRPTLKVLTPPSTTLQVEVENNLITFSGAYQQNTNVHVVINRQYDVNTQLTASSGTLADVVNEVATNINAAGLGLTATAYGGDMVRITGSPLFELDCYAAGSGTFIREVNRFERKVQVSIWASDPWTRALLKDAIDQNVGLPGVASSQWIELPDGTALRVRNSGDEFDDDSQSASSMYIAHTRMLVEYGIMQTVVGYAIGASKLVLTENKNPPITQWSGATGPPPINGDDMPLPTENALDVGVPTVIKTGPGWVFMADVTAPGAGPGALYDNTSIGSGNTDATRIGWVGAEIDEYSFNAFPFTNGLVFVPGPGQVASISYT